INWPDLRMNAKVVKYAPIAISSDDGPGGPGPGGPGPARSCAFRPLPAVGEPEGAAIGRPGSGFTGAGILYLVRTPSPLKLNRLCVASSYRSSAWLLPRSSALVCRQQRFCAMLCCGCVMRLSLTYSTLGCGYGTCWHR